MEFLDLGSSASWGKCSQFVEVFVFLIQAWWNDKSYRKLSVPWPNFLIMDLFFVFWSGSWIYIMCIGNGGVTSKMGPSPNCKGKGGLKVKGELLTKKKKK